MAESYKHQYQEKVAKRLYDSGRIGKEELAALVERNAITESAYRRICGDDYDA